MLSKPPSSLRGLEKPTMMIWLGILTIYLTLFMTTGYFSFVQADMPTGYEQYQQLSTVKDKEAKALLLEVLEKEESEHINRRNLARQSFHVVLGALLGFMSISAASILKRKNDE